MMTDRNSRLGRPYSRRAILKGSLATTATLGALTIGKAGPMNLISGAWAQAAQPAIGTYPAGTTGNTVTIGATVPQTGTYAVPGGDELKGMQLAVEHINNGDPLLKAIAP